MTHLTQNVKSQLQEAQKVAGRLNTKRELQLWSCRPKSQNRQKQTGANLNRTKKKKKKYQEN